MALSLYDATVANYLQILGGLSGVLDRGLAHFQENNIDPESIVETRLAPDMLPFRFQIISVAQHSRGAIEGVQQGVFKPPAFKTPYDYAGLQGLVADTQKALSALTPETVNALGGKDVVFHLGERAIALHGGGLSDVVLAAELLFPRHHRLRHPAHQWRSARASGISWGG